MTTADDFQLVSEATTTLADVLPKPRTRREDLIVLILEFADWEKQWSAACEDGKVEDDRVQELLFDGVDLLQELVPTILAAQPNLGVTL